MKIDNSSIKMASYRSYQAKAEETQATIIRSYNGDSLQSANVRTTEMKLSRFEVEGGTAYYTTSADGMTRTDDGSISYRQDESKPIGQGSFSRVPVSVTASGSGNWISSWLSGLDLDPEMDFLRKLLEMLERFTGKKGSGDSGNLLDYHTGSVRRTSAYRVSAASARYRQTMASFGRSSTNGAGVFNFADGQSTNVNGRWTKQTVQSGFVSGQENTAFSSVGTVVTSDGRSIDFQITMEMSRSFAAAYEITSAEEIYTDPLVINMDTDAASLSDVSFYFDLDSDGTAEEIAGLNSNSGFLAYDKNGDGQINDGTELFGARTGDGFSELAAYDQDGNGWIDENDDIYSRLSVWVKCGTEEAELLTLSEANVGAIFLGSQSTQYSLANSDGEEGAMVRKTGIYLKESGQAGTVQHVDFKA